MIARHSLVWSGPFEYTFDARGYTCGLGMRARSEHRQRVGGASVRVKRCRGVGAGVQQPGGDLGSVGGDDLATDLDPVGGRVMQERGAVAIHRPASDQIGVVHQETSQFLHPAEYDRVYLVLQPASSIV